MVGQGRRDYWTDAVGRCASNSKSRAIQDGHAFRAAPLGAGDMISATEAAAISGMSRSTVNN
jgi:hypothetical protein